MCVSAGQFACDGVNTGIKTCSLRQAVIWIPKNKNFRIFVTRITSTAQTALTRCMKRIHAEQNVNLSHFYSKSAFFKPKSIENHVKFRFRPVHLSCYSQLTTHKLFVRSYLQQIDTIFRPAELRKHQNCLFFYGPCIQIRPFRLGIGKKKIFFPSKTEPRQDHPGRLRRAPLPCLPPRHLQGIL